MGSIPPLPILQPQVGGVRPTGVISQSGTSTQGPNIGPGISDFVDKYLTNKQAQEQHNKQSFFEGLQLMQQGIPVDHEKLMKYAKKGGLDFLPTELPTDTEMQAEAQRKAQKQMMEAPAGSMGTPTIPQQMVPQQPPNLLNRIGQKLGVVQPQVSDQSPMGQWLQQMAQAGQAGGGLAETTQQRGELQKMTAHLEAGLGIKMKEMSTEQQIDLLNTMKQATHGTGAQQQQAIEHLTRQGVMKELPIDEFTIGMMRANDAEPPEKRLPVEQVKANAALMYLNVKMGGPQIKLHQMTMMKDMLPYFRNAEGGPDAAAAGQFVSDIWTKGTSQLKPQMSIEQYKDVMSTVNEMQDKQPTLPLNLGVATAFATLNGNKETRKALLDAASQYPTKGSIDIKKQQIQIGYDYAQLAQKAHSEQEQLNLAVATELGKANHVAFEDWWKAAQDPNATQEERKGYVQMMANAKDSLKGLTIKYRGSEVSIGDQQVQALSEWSPSFFHPLKDRDFLAPQKAPDAILSKYLSDPAQAAKLPAIRQFAQQALAMPDGKDRMRALGVVIQAMQQLPKASRQALLKSLQLPPEMQKAAIEAVDLEPITINPNPILK